MTITSRLLVIMVVGGWGAWANAHANANANPESNQQFIEHLNRNYPNLDLVQAKSADAIAVDRELSSLELIMGYQLNTPHAQLIHLTCTNPACCGGGCCNGVCDRTNGDEDSTPP